MGLDIDKLKSKTENEIIKTIDYLKKYRNVTPEIHAIIVGENFASKKYVDNQVKLCNKLGIKHFTHTLPEDVTESQILSLINILNHDNEVNGIIVQMPLPKHLDEEKILNAISPEKDLDGFHPINVGRLHMGLDVTGRIPCTAQGVLEIIKAIGEPIKGKKAVIVGRSNIVGRPVSILLEREDATVTICHSSTSYNELVNELRTADIIVTAIGKPKIITKRMVGFRQIIIDVGFNKDESGNICGDVDYDDILPISKYITPVPGGVGQITKLMLIKNLVENTKRLIK